MIESDIIPQQAVEFLNRIEQNKLAEAQALGREGARQELLNWAVQWYTTAQVWRKQSFENEWLMWQRNADGRYDLNLAAKKKDWQAKEFVDLTPSHRENIQAELFRLVAGSRPLLDVTNRPGGDPAQAENVRDLINRELEKSKFEVEHNGVVEDKTTYGSGFSRLWFEERWEDRVTRKPITEPLNNPMAVIRSMQGKPKILGYQSQVEKKLIYRGVRIQHVSIWDVFPDPKALGVEGHPHAIRSYLNLQAVMDGIKTGIYMPEAGAALSQEASNETTPADKIPVQMERGISDDAPRREGYQKAWEFYELFARVPQKWAFPLLGPYQQQPGQPQIIPPQVTEPDCLIPVRIIFHKKTILAVELNKKYDGEAPLYKDDYLPVTGRYYARGVPEMLKNPQAVINAVVNQRLDEGNLALDEGFAIKEKALANPDEFLAGGPGKIARINEKNTGPNGDIRNAIMNLGRPDVKINAGFVEVHEWERMAQERTSANKVVLASPGSYQGANKTLGGQQLLKQTAGEKFAYIAMLSEFRYIIKVMRGYWELEYTNLTPQDVLNALGQERAQGFQLLSPEDIEQGYKYEPKGIFEREAKSELHGRLQAMHEQFRGMPGLNDMAFFDGEMKSFNMDPERFKFKNADMQFLQAQAQKMAEPLAKQMIAEILIGKAVKDIENNLAEAMADKADGAKEEKVKGVDNLATSKKEGKGSL